MFDLPYYPYIMQIFNIHNQAESSQQIDMSVALFIKCTSHGQSDMHTSFCLISARARRYLGYRVKPASKSPYSRFSLGDFFRAKSHSIVKIE